MIAGWGAGERDNVGGDGGQTRAEETEVESEGEGHTEGERLQRAAAFHSKHKSSFCLPAVVR